MGIGRMIDRAGEAAGLSFPVHSTGYALATRGMDTRRLQHFLGHASITNTVRIYFVNAERGEAEIVCEPQIVGWQPLSNEQIDEIMRRRAAPQAEGVAA
jgi:integrase